VLLVTSRSSRTVVLVLGDDVEVFADDVSVLGGVGSEAVDDGRGSTPRPS